MHTANEVVRFRIGDVFAPPATEVIELLYRDQVLEGEVLGEVTHDEDGACVVVRVAGLVEPLIVARQVLLGRALQPSVQP